MKVNELMTRDVTLIAPDRSIQDAARIMAELDVGALPVGDGDRLVGMISDRDIVIRAVYDGKGPETPVREAMSEGVRYCFEDEEVSHVVSNMGEQKIRRLPVLNRKKRLIGIVSLGDLATAQALPAAVGMALGDISRPGAILSGAGNEARH